MREFVRHRCTCTDQSNRTLNRLQITCDPRSAFLTAAQLFKVPQQPFNFGPKFIKLNLCSTHFIRWLYSWAAYRKYRLVHLWLVSSQHHTSCGWFQMSSKHQKNLFFTKIFVNFYNSWNESRTDGAYSSSISILHQNHLYLMLYGIWSSTSQIIIPTWSSYNCGTLYKKS